MATGFRISLSMALASPRAPAGSFYAFEAIVSNDSDGMEEFFLIRELSVSLRIG